jgi:hypothetical protein
MTAISADVFVPRSRTVGGDRAFYVVGLNAWNSLPTFIQENNNINTFKHLLKTHLFSSRLTYINYVCTATPQGAYVRHFTGNTDVHLM